MLMELKRLPRRGICGKANSFTCIGRDSSDSHLSLRPREGVFKETAEQDIDYLADFLDIEDRGLVI